MRVWSAVAVCLAVAACASAASLRGMPACHGDFCAVSRVSSESVTVPVLLAVKHANVEAFEQLFWDVSTPGSPRFRQFLSLDEMNAMISNPEATAAVTAFVTAKLGVAEADMFVTPGGEFVRFRAPLAAVEAVFGAEYYLWQHRATGQQTRRSVEAKLPAELTPFVDFVAYITDFPKHFSAHSPRLSSEVADTDVKVTPDVIFSAYGVQPHTADHQTTMAVFETLNQAYSPSDLSTFQQQFNVPSDGVVNVIGPNKPNSCESNPNNCVEANLDVQYILGVAQDAALTFWSIPADDQTPYYDWIVAVSQDANPPAVQSVSYGDVQNDYPQAVQQRTNLEFQKMGARGLSIFIAAGDDGVANFPARSNAQDCGFNPSWPAASPYVTAVGATQFIGGTPDNGQEGASVQNSPAAIITTGGGFSAYDSIPSYQSDAVSHFLNTAQLPPDHTGSSFPSPGFNAQGRGYPDIAALGHNFQVVINGNTYSVDGTSAAAPTAAGMFALINHQRQQAGLSTLGFLNPTLYSLAGTSAFTDLTRGTNNCCAYPGQNAQQVCCTYGFSAQEGWDPVTGLGTINFQAMASQLTSQ